MLANRYQFLTCARILGACATVLTGPVAAQGVNPVYPVPEGCTAFLTVQSRTCILSHHFRCDFDPDGLHWRASLDQEGPFFLDHNDAEFRWLRGYNGRNGDTHVLIEPEDDPASISELLETGRDTMVFSIDVVGAGGVSRRDYTGFVALTGNSITIDGVVLDMTEFRYEWTDEAGSTVVEGNQFLNREMGLVFGGIETVSTPSGDTFEGNYSPVTFHRPGEPGFLSTEPQHDCGDTLSGAHSAPNAIPARARAADPTPSLRRD